MKVLLTLYGEERGAEAFSPEEGAREMAAWQAFDEAARAAGVLIACEGLEDSQSATTVRVDGGNREVTDGPFIETKEQLGGFIVLECAISTTRSSGRRRRRGTTTAASRRSAP